MKYFILSLLSSFLFISLFILPTHGQENMVKEGPVLVISSSSGIYEKKSMMQKYVINCIKEYSKLYGVDEDLALNIAKAESNFDYKAKNPKSSAEGTFQIIDSTWIHTMDMMGLSTSTSKIEIPISIEAGVYLLSKEGSGHWSSSKSSWLVKK